MTTEEALEIVSYKLGVKNGVAALEDSILITETVQQAIDDTIDGSIRAIDLKSYMQATKIVKQRRMEEFNAENCRFLQQVAQQPEVLTTASGLLYEVIEQGAGVAKLGVDDRVRAHYHGTLIDGTVFDSSVVRGQPSEFQVAKLIAGWREGLQLMPVGSKYRFFIPQELGYGARGAESKVPPYATLIFEVELLNVC